MAIGKKRKTGIVEVDDMPWGTHFCHFYQTRQDLHDIVFPYLKIGLENREACLWIITEDLNQETMSALRQAIPHIDGHLTEGDIEVILYSQWYLEGDTFAPERVINGWKAKLAQALAKGYTGLRVAADEAWLGKKYWNAFSKYEQGLNQTIAKQHMIVLCTYPLTVTKASAIFDVTRTHQFSIAKRNGSWEVLETPEMKIAKTELKKLNDKLEKTVAERTKELKVINEALQRKIAERDQLEEERHAHLRFLESMDQVNRAMQGTNDLKKMMSDVLDVLLSTFNCDRAWLIYPCDPDTATWQVPMERTRPEYPGVLPIGVELPLNPACAAVYRILRDSPGLVQFSPGSDHQVPKEMVQSLGVQSFIAMAFYPKVGKPWAFGLHQCSSPRIWTADEERLFQEIGRRLSDALTSLLTYRNLQDSELRIREIFDNTSDVIVISEVTEDGRFKLLDFNPAWENMAGLSRTKVIGRSLEEFSTNEAIRKMLEQYHVCLEKKGPINFEQEFDTAKGYWYFHTTLVPVSNAAGNIYRLISVSRNVTELKRAEETLRHLNRELSAITNCNQTLLRAVDEQSLLNDICHIICDEAGYRLAWVGYAEHDKAKTVRSVAWAGFDSGYIANAKLSWSDKTERGQGPAGKAVRSGEIIYVQDFTTDTQMAPWRKSALQHGYRSGIALPLKDENAQVFGVLLIYSAEVNAITTDEIRLMDDLSRDLAFGIVTLRTRAERARAEQIMQARLRLIQFANTHSLEELLQATLDETEDLTGSSIGFYHFLDPDQKTLRLQAWSTNTLEKMCTAEGKGSHYPIEQAGVWVDCVHARKPVIHNDYASLPHRKGMPKGHASVLRELVTPVFRGDKIVAILGVGNKPTNYDQNDVKATEMLADLAWDIAERKRAEEEIGKLSNAVEQSPASIVITDISGDIEYVNPKFTQITGYTYDEAIGKNPRILKTGETAQEDYKRLWDIITHGGVWNGEFHNKKKDGELYWESASISPVLDSQGNIKHFVAVKEDITARKQVEEVAALRLAELEALTKVSTSLRKAQSRTEMMAIILEELLTLLKAEGAAFAMRDLATSETIIEFAAGELTPLTGHRLALGEGVCGYVIQTGKTYVNNDARSDSRFFGLDLLKKIQALACTPLIAREKTIGSLLIGYTSPMDEHDIQLLDAIADMAANAIQRVTLHEQTQQDALELTLAYETAIEGWSHALDLRDKETEGHTVRVTEMTLKLAQEAGMTEDELLHVKRGALLHDIGKVGVPDAILLKPDKLTDTEWIVMRRHPQYAYDMLSPIAYLKPALDIPYCHHEKWDGSGYPRGLKGEQIPLAARLFAVVDVWDALISNRPYRAAWSEEKACEYIREQAGLHFDPKAVELFFQVINGCS